MCSSVWHCILNQIKPIVVHVVVVVQVSSGIWRLKSNVATEDCFWIKGNLIFLCRPRFSHVDLDFLLLSSFCGADCLTGCLLERGEEHGRRCGACGSLHSQKFWVKLNLFSYMDLIFPCGPWFLVNGLLCDAGCLTGYLLERKEEHGWGCGACGSLHSQRQFSMGKLEFFKYF